MSADFSVKFLNLISRSFFKIIFYKARKNSIKKYERVLLFQFGSLLTKLSESVFTNN